MSTKPLLLSAAHPISKTEREVGRKAETADMNKRRRMRRIVAGRGCCLI